MRRLITLLCLSVVFTFPTRADDIVVGSFNIEWFGHGNHPRSDDQIELLANYIKSLEINVLACQEISPTGDKSGNGRSDWQDLKEALGEDYGTWYGNTGSSQRLAFIWKNDRVELSDIGELKTVNRESEVSNQRKGSTMELSRTKLAIAIVAPTLLCSVSTAQTGPPAWADYLDSAQFGTEGAENIKAYIVFDDGSGQGDRLFVGGDFVSFGGAEVGNVIAVDSTGRHIDDLDGGLLFGAIHDFAVYDLKLYACGDFQSIANGLQMTRGIATWNGTAWEPVRDVGQAVTGINPYIHTIDSMEVYDPGTGEQLYVGGSFDEFYTAAQTGADGIASWDGTAWTPYTFIGADPDSIFALKSFDGYLYVGGSFESAFGVLGANSIVEWNGTSGVGAKMGTGAIAGVYFYNGGFGNESPGTVSCLEVFNDGSGDELYVGGDFDRAGDVVLKPYVKDDGMQAGIAMWPSGGASGWVGLPKGGHHKATFVFLGVSSMCVAPLGPSGADALVVSGRNTANSLSNPSNIPPPAPRGWEDRLVLTWDGSVWDTFGSHVTSTDGRSPQLEPYVSGLGHPPAALGVFDGAVYYAEFVDVSSESPLLDGAVFLAQYHWTENTKTVVGGGFGGTVRDFIIYDFGQGPELVACGDFRSAALDPDIDDPSALMVAVWDPDSLTWKSMMNGLAPVDVLDANLKIHRVAHGNIGSSETDETSVTQLEVHGGTLWASGRFIHEDELVGDPLMVYGLAMWNPLATPSTWELRGQLITGDLATKPDPHHGGEIVRTLASYEGRLYASVEPGLPVYNGAAEVTHTGLLEWRLLEGGTWVDPSTYVNIPPSLEMNIYAMEVFEGNLFMGGLLDTYANRALAKLLYDPTGPSFTFSMVGVFGDSTGDTVYSLAVGDPDGNGPGAEILAVGGLFESVGDGATQLSGTSSIAQLALNGPIFEFSALDQGIRKYNNGTPYEGDVRALHFGPDAQDPAMQVLYAGGNFDFLTIGPISQIDAMNFGAFDFDQGKWRGESNFDGGVTNEAGAVNVLAIESSEVSPIQDGVFVGGVFTTVGALTTAGTSSGNVAIWLLPPGCYADCDQSTGVGVLDLFDFLCFQQEFVNNTPYACNCDTSTGPDICDLFDFLCFQDAFIAGCP